MFTISNNNTYWGTCNPLADQLCQPHLICSSKSIAQIRTSIVSGNKSDLVTLVQFACETFLESDPSRFCASHETDNIIITCKETGEAVSLRALVVQFGKCQGLKNENDAWNAILLNLPIPQTLNIKDTDSFSRMAYEVAQNTKISIEQGESIDSFLLQLTVQSLDGRPFSLSKVQLETPISNHNNGDLSLKLIIYSHWRSMTFPKPNEIMKLASNRDFDAIRERFGTLPCPGDINHSIRNDDLNGYRLFIWHRSISSQSRTPLALAALHEDEAVNIHCPYSVKLFRDYPLPQRVSALADAIEELLQKLPPEDSVESTLHKAQREIYLVVASNRLEIPIPVEKLIAEYLEAYSELYELYQYRDGSREPTDWYLEMNRCSLNQLLSPSALRAVKTNNVYGLCSLDDISHKFSRVFRDRFQSSISDFIENALKDEQTEIDGEARLVDLFKLYTCRWLKLSPLDPLTDFVIDQMRPFALANLIGDMVLKHGCSPPTLEIKSLETIYALAPRRERPLKKQDYEEALVELTHKLFANDPANILPDAATLATFVLQPNGQVITLVRILEEYSQRMEPRVDNYDTERTERAIKCNARTALEAFQQRDRNPKNSLLLPILDQFHLWDPPAVRARVLREALTEIFKLLGPTGFSFHGTIGAMNFHCSLGRSFSLQKLAQECRCAEAQPSGRSVKNSRRIPKQSNAMKLGALKRELIEEYIDEQMEALDKNPEFQEFRLHFTKRRPSTPPPMLTAPAINLGGEKCVIPLGKLDALPLCVVLNASLSDNSVTLVPCRFAEQGSSKDRYFEVRAGSQILGRFAFSHSRGLVDRFSPELATREMIRDELASFCECLGTEAFGELLNDYSANVADLIFGVVGLRLRGHYDPEQFAQLIRSELTTMISRAAGLEPSLIPLTTISDNEEKEELALEEDSDDPVVGHSDSLGDPLSSSENVTTDTSDKDTEQLYYRTERLASLIQKRIDEEQGQTALQFVVREQAGNFFRFLVMQQLLLHCAPSKSINEAVKMADTWINTRLARDSVAILKETLLDLQRQVAQCKDCHEHLHRLGLSAETELGLYQLIGSMEGVRIKRILNADHTGLGKTLQTLCTFLLSGERIMLVIVPTPVRWIEDISRHLNCPMELFVLSSGTITDKLSSALAAKSQIKFEYSRTHDRQMGIIQDTTTPSSRRIIVTTPETFRELAKDFSAPLQVGVVVIDEATVIKNPYAGRSEAVLEFENGTPAIEAPFRIAITATPLDNGLDDLNPILRFVAQGGTSDVDRFTASLTPARWNALFRNDDIGSLSIVNSMLRRCTIRRSISQAGLKLPELVQKKLLVNPTTATAKLILKNNDKVEKEYQLTGMYEEQYALYEFARKQACAFEMQVIRALPPALSEDEAVVVATEDTQQVRYLRMEEVALTPKLVGRDLPSIKIDVLIEVIAERLNSGKRVAVLCSLSSALPIYRQEIEEALRKKHITVTSEFVDQSVVDTKYDPARSLALEAVQSGKVNLFFGSVGTVGTSIELTAIDTVISINQDWKDSTHQQKLGRFLRGHSSWNFEGRQVELIEVIYDVPHPIDLAKERLREGKRILACIAVDGTLTPEVRALLTSDERQLVRLLGEDPASPLRIQPDDEAHLRGLHQAMRRIVQQTTSGRKGSRGWDQLSEPYAATCENKAWFLLNMAAINYLMRNVLPEVNTIQRGDVLVLDVGSGPSTLTRAANRLEDQLAIRGYRFVVTDLDGSREMLSLGLNPPERRISCELSEITQNVAPESFHIVNISYVWRLARSPAKLITGAYHALKPGGLVIIVLPSSNQVGSSFRPALERAGFKVLTSDGDGLESYVDEKQQKIIEKLYGPEMSADIIHAARARCTFFLLQKSSLPIGTISDDDFAIFRKIPVVDEEKIVKIARNPGQITIIPKELVVEGNLLNQGQKGIKNEFEVFYKKVSSLFSRLAVIACQYPTEGRIHREKPRVAEQLRNRQSRLSRQISSQQNSVRIFAPSSMKYAPSIPQKVGLTATLLSYQILKNN
jgi:SAM-dependent methyltransferase/SNF2 family DNA or RNA helicase